MAHLFIDPEVAFRHLVVEFGSRQGVVRGVERDGLAVIEEEEEPVGTVDIDVQQGVLRSLAFQLEGAAGDDGAVDALRVDPVDQIDGLAVLRSAGAGYVVLYVAVGAGDRPDGGKSQGNKG